MECKKLDLDSICAAEISQILRILKGPGRYYPTLADLKQLTRNLDIYLFYDGDKIIGILDADASCRYFGGCLMLGNARVHWSYNRETVISGMIQSVIRHHSATVVALDVHRHRDFNRNLYHAMGFEESLLPSPAGGEYMIMAGNAARLLSHAPEAKNPS